MLAEKSPLLNAHEITPRAEKCAGNVCCSTTVHKVNFVHHSIMNYFYH